MNKLKFGMSILATVLMAVASLCHLSALYGSTLARVAARGTWCERTGRTYNVNGELVESGRWSEDGGATWRKP